METTTTCRQRSTIMKGSFINCLMGNNSTLPEVGKGATILLYSDRHAYEVIEVSADKMKCTLQRYVAEREDKNGMSDCQSYKYEKLTDEKITLIWRQGAWREVNEMIVFTKEFRAAHENLYSIEKILTKEQIAEIYGEHPFPQKIYPGITRLSRSYNKVRILFGVKDEHFDYSF